MRNQAARTVASVDAGETKTRNALVMLDVGVTAAVVAIRAVIRAVGTAVANHRRGNNAVSFRYVVPDLQSEFNPITAKLG